jgi:glycine betaine/proline transport system substrate-binding protein
LRAARAQAYWRQIEDDVVQVSPLYDGALFCWAVPDYVPADQVAAPPDLLRPEVTERMATLVVQGTTPGAGLTVRSQELVGEYGLTRSAGATGSGTWQIISTVNARSPPGTGSSPALAARST